MNKLVKYFAFLSSFIPISTASAMEPTYEDAILCSVAYTEAVRRHPNLLTNIGVYMSAFQLLAISIRNPKLVEYEGEELDVLLSREFSLIGGSLSTTQDSLKTESIDFIKHIISDCVRYEEAALDIFNSISSQLDLR